jgi:ABC-type transporter Mla maintaining outer membrane lipid asymmetry permease subunit MlaE
VLLTAILMAGRTASAFTAQIGSMKANEEIDAIRTLGLDPMELLVVPRVLALLVALPMLTFLAMICGIVGGAVVRGDAGYRRRCSSRCCNRTSAFSTFWWAWSKRRSSPS